MDPRTIFGLGLIALSALLIVAVVQGGVFWGQRLATTEATLSAQAFAELVSREVAQAVPPGNSEALVHISNHGRTLTFNQAPHAVASQLIPCQISAVPLSNGLFSINVQGVRQGSIFLHDLLFQYFPADKASLEGGGIVRVTFWAADTTGSVRLPSVVVKSIDGCGGGQ